MVIDFKEIPQANKGGSGQDTFEQFACDFLETIGFTIVRRPDRGPDGKKDLIVTETRNGIGGKTTIHWLVSCKHYAHSNASVKDTDEEDVYDRVINHQCQGFIGFYSTIQAASLSNKLHGLSSKIEYLVYDSVRIEKELLLSSQKERLLTSFFPNSHDKFRQNIFTTTEAATKVTGTSNLTEEDVLRITKTAIIILEIGKIKEEYYNEGWEGKEASLNKLYRFTDHTNEKVAGEVFQFLSSVSHQTRHNMLWDIPSAIHSLVLSFFPSSYDSEREDRIQNGKKCIYIGFDLTYDALIYLNNFRIAEYGLSILKFIYREGKRNNMPELVEAVEKQYKELEQTLNRPERNDLEKAKEIVKIFKDDLEIPDLSFPVLPDHFYKLT